MTTTFLFDEWISADTDLTFGEWLDTRVSSDEKRWLANFPATAPHYVGPSPDTATPAELARILSGHTFTNKFNSFNAPKY